MKPEEKVFAALADKTKVELGVIDDAKSGIKIVLDSYKNPVWNQLQRLPSLVLEVVSEANSVVKDALKGQQIAITNARKAVEFSKELGVPVPKEIQDIFSNNDYDDMLNSLDDLVNKIISNAKR